MDCYLALCIYNEEHKCLLQNICIDETGMCNSCIYLVVPDEKLKEQKTFQRSFLEKDFLLQK